MFPHDGKKFEKGTSGNPKGRPKGSKNRTTVVREMLDLIVKDKNPLDIVGKSPEQILLEYEDKDINIEGSLEEFITLAIIAKAKAGDVMAYKVLMDSLYGTPKQTIEQTDTTVKPPKLNFTRKS